VLKRPLSALLATLVAWLCVGTVERSAAARLGDLTWGADAGHAVVGHVTRPERTVARPSTSRGVDGVFGGWLLAAGPTVPPPSVALVRRSTRPRLAPAEAGFTERGARGPPANLG
jgi:hypothetical protein